MEHEKLHDSDTILVEKQKRFGRIDFTPCNQLAHKFLEGFKQKSFGPDDLRFLQSMGYCVLLQGTETREFEDGLG